MALPGGWREAASDTFCEVTVAGGSGSYWGAPPEVAGCVSEEVYDVCHWCGSEDWTALRHIRGIFGCGILGLLDGIWIQTTDILDPCLDTLSLPRLDIWMVERMSPRPNGAEGRSGSSFDCLQPYVLK